MEKPSRKLCHDYNYILIRISINTSIGISISINSMSTTVYQEVLYFAVCKPASSAQFKELCDDKVTSHCMCTVRQLLKQKKLVIGTVVAVWRRCLLHSFFICPQCAQRNPQNFRWRTCLLFRRPSMYVSRGVYRKLWYVEVYLYVAFLVSKHFTRMLHSPAGTPKAEAAVQGAI